MNATTAAAVLAAAIAWGQPACAEPARDPASRHEASTVVRGTKLQLNGAGVRYKAVFQVYSAALYLPRRSSAPDDVIAMPGAKRVALTMLREIDATELGKLFSRGMEDNMERSAFSRLVPGIMRMSQIFSEQKRLNPGDAVSIDWVPGMGTLVTVRGVQQGEPFKEPEFFQALLRIWLGRQPADWRLKDALLGKPPATQAQSSL